MTVRQSRPSANGALGTILTDTVTETLTRMLSELRESPGQSSALDSAVVAAIEGAVLLGSAAEQAERNGDEGAAVELARQALGAMRASVIAATVSVRTLEDRRRSVSPVATSAGDGTTREN